NQRHMALEKAGFAPQDASMQSWLSNPSQTAAIKGWNELLAQVAAAKELNRINGLLISKHMARNQTALNVLHTAPQSGNFYGPNGQSTITTSTRSLVVG
ncbi:MAG: flagellar protein FlgN, partial [Pseudomonadota bacterium]